MEFGGEIISPADFETDVYRMRSIWQVGEGVYPRMGFHVCSAS